MAEASLLWNRSASVIVGKRGEIGTRFSALRITFDITKTDEANPNKAKIQIYGMNSSSRALLQDTAALVVVLEVGYGGTLKRLFIGDIIRAYPVYKGPDIIMNIEAGEGEEAVNKAHIEKSYATGTDIKTIVEDVTAKMAEAGGIVVDTLKNVASERTQNGFTASGMARDVLSNILTNQGLEFNVQDDKLRILTPTQDTGEAVILLSPQTGLISTPVIRKEAEKETIVEFAALLQSTEVWPGRRVKIVSNAVTGVYRVIKARFKGDTHANDWHVFAEGR